MANILESNTVVQELTSFTDEDVRALDELMHELSSRSSCSKELLLSIMEDTNAHLYVIRDNASIIGSACLCVAHTTEQKLGFVESVVLSHLYRGQHLGERLMIHIINEAKRLSVRSLHLTSNPRRVAANALYQKVGFERYETNVYKMKIEDVDAK